MIIYLSQPEPEPIVVPPPPPVIEKVYEGSYIEAEDGTIITEDVIWGEPDTGKEKSYRWIDMIGEPPVETADQGEQVAEKEGELIEAESKG